MFLDTSIIIEIITRDIDSERSRRIFEIIEGEYLSVSLIQLGEVSDWYLRNGIDPAEAVELLKDIVKVMPLDERIVLKGSRLKEQRRSDGHFKFSLIDGIILASALEMNEKLLTLDSDFQGLDSVIWLGDE